ncbi:MAG: sugar phosphate nucleotidyltransferase [Thermodesulfobacteriota bacterium]
MPSSRERKIAFVLAGGLGTRLRPIIDNLPKVLAPIEGRPFITYLLDQLDKAKFNRAVLCTGYLGEVVQATIGENYRGLMIQYSQEKTKMGTGGAIRLAYDNFKNGSLDNILAINGDSFCREDLNKLWINHIRNKAAGTILLKKMNNIDRYGSVSVDRLGNITSFIEKKGKKEKGLINTGIYVLNKKIIQSINVGGEVSLEHDIFPKWLGNGLLGIETGAPFIDIGTPSSFKEAQQILKDK